MADAGSSDKLKVFISYSRRDSSEFVEELLKGLELLGFAPFLDGADIVHGEPWEDRLEQLIRDADTVVFVISPEAVKSERCRWEVDKTLALSKRLMPVVFKPVPEAEIPVQLGQRQFARFDTGAGFVGPLGQLAEALRQDLVWIREHTRLGDLAGRWEARGRPEWLLLRGEDIAAAKAWVDRRKADAPIIPELMLAFIAASKQTEATRLRRNRLVLVVVGALFATIVAVLVAAITAWRNKDWLTEEFYAVANVSALKTAQEHALKAGDSLKECTDCPEMIVVPAGQFILGSPSNELGRYDNEGPQKAAEVAKPFAVSKFELTFNEWVTCAAHGDCDPHIGATVAPGPDRPAINVSWDDARRYVAWLSRITGKKYRLLSETEYEYAARAGTQTVYPWGDDIKQNGMAMANCNGCGSVWDGGRTAAPVGSFPPNKFGLYDMVGNVSEWVEDCYQSSHQVVPPGGGPWTAAYDCSLRGTLGVHTVRGGSWNEPPRDLRSARREGKPREFRSNNLGFRVARTLNTP